MKPKPWGNCFAILEAVLKPWSPPKRRRFLAKVEGVRLRLARLASKKLEELRPPAFPVQARLRPPVDKTGGGPLLPREEDAWAES